MCTQVERRTLTPPLDTPCFTCGTPDEGCVQQIPGPVKGPIPPTGPAPPQPVAPRLVLGYHEEIATLFVLFWRRGGGETLQYRRPTAEIRSTPSAGVTVRADPGVTVWGHPGVTVRADPGVTAWGHPGVTEGVFTLVTPSSLFDVHVNFSDGVKELGFHVVDDVSFSDAGIEGVFVLVTSTSTADCNCNFS